MRTASRCCPELRREMHARKPGRLRKIGETDALFKMSTDVFLDALYPPLGQRFDRVPRWLKSCDVHDQGLGKAFDVDAVVRGAAFDQRFAEQLGKRVTDNEIVQVPDRLGLA